MVGIMVRAAASSPTAPMIWTATGSNCTTISFGTMPDSIPTPGTFCPDDTVATIAAPVMPSMLMVFIVCSRTTPGPAARSDHATTPRCLIRPEPPRSDDPSPRLGCLARVGNYGHVDGESTHFAG
jgi:hypothetical protein